MIVTGDDGSSPANLQSLIQVAMLQFTDGLPQEETEKQQAQSTLQELVVRFDEVTALPHTERFPALKLIASYCSPQLVLNADDAKLARTREIAYNIIYSTDENDLSFTEKKEFFEERVASHTNYEERSRRIKKEYERFLRNLQNLGGLNSLVMAVQYIESNLKKEATPILKELDLWRYYTRTVKEAKKHNQFPANSGEAEPSYAKRLLGKVTVPSGLVTTLILFALGGSYLYSTVFNTTNGSDSQTPQKDEQTVEAQVSSQVSSTDYFQQYKQSPSFPSQYIISKGQEKTFNALSQQCIAGFTQYLDNNGVSVEGLDVKSPCNSFLYFDALKKNNLSVGGNDNLLNSDGKYYKKKGKLTVPLK